MNPAARLIRRHSRRLGLALALLSVITVGTYLLWPHDTTAPPMVTAANYSGRPTACLATDSTDSRSLPVAQSVWKAMQEASRGKAINVQQLVVSAGSRDRAVPYLAGLVAQHCTLIVAIGPSFTDALPDIAKVSPATQLTAVTTAGHPAPKGIVAVIGKTDEQAAEIARQVSGLSSHGA